MSQTVEAICSHSSLPPIRKPVSSMCLTGAAATRSRNHRRSPEAHGTILTDPGNGRGDHLPPNIGLRAASRFSGSNR